MHNYERKAFIYICFSKKADSSTNTQAPNKDTEAYDKDQSVIKTTKTFILVINQLDAQNLFYSKFISCLYMFRAPYAHRQEVKIILHSLWHHHTYRCDDTRQWRTQEYFRGGVQQIQLRTKDRENGDLGAVAL